MKLPYYSPQDILLYSVLLLGLLLLGISTSIRAENIVFPTDAGMVNVRDMGAKGDGVTDDTEAIQNAIEKGGARGIIYVPNGTYLVSSTLAWKGKATRTILQGQSVDGAIIKLRDYCQGFTDPTNPRPVIVTGYFPPQRFRNAIRNLTVDTGKGNHGAIGIRFNASNQGQMNAVAIRSGDSSGIIGLDMGYTGDVGPLLVRDLQVTGFDIGIYTAYATAFQALEHITLRNQRLYGWVNDGQTIAVRGLISDNEVTALWNKRGSGVVTLLDSRLNGYGEASELPAIINEQAMYVRNVTTSGYAMALDGSAGTGLNVDGELIDEFSSHGVQKLFASPDSMLNLPVEETPEVPWDDPEDWVSVIDFASEEMTKDKKADWTEAVQAAIDSGATTVYFPHHSVSGVEYRVDGPIYIRNNVRRIIGMETKFMARNPTEFILQDGAWPDVVVERFEWVYTPVIFRTESDRNLAIKALNCYLDVGPGGRVFLEDGVFHFKMAQNSKLWIRQFNTEYTHEPRHNILWSDSMDIADHPGNLNAGGDLWVLGTKLEGDGRLITTNNGGRSEILGGLIYANKASFEDKRAFVVEDGELSFCVGEWVARDQPFYMVEETRENVTRVREPRAWPRRGNGSLYTLFSGHTGPEATLVIDEQVEHEAIDRGTGNGLSASYFMGEFGEVLQKTVQPIDIKLGDNVQDDAFSVVWAGFIEPYKSGVHRFKTSTHGMRLLIDGRNVIDAWRNGARYLSGSFKMQSGQRYPIKVMYRSPGKTSDEFDLLWRPPGEQFQEVPATQLYEDAEAMPEITLEASKNEIKEGDGEVILYFERSGETDEPLTVQLLPRTDMDMAMSMNHAARGKAIPGEDISLVPHQIIFPAGESELSYPIAVLDDDQPEKLENLFVELAPSHSYNIASPRVSISITDNDSPEAGKGIGLQGNYYKGKSFDELILTRVDPEIDFNWDKSPAVKGQNPKKGYAIRWTGQLEPLFTDKYKITIKGSVYSAFRLWVDGDLVINVTNESEKVKGKRGKGVPYATLDLEAGKEYEIIMEYVATNFYGQYVKLLWSSANQFEEVIPATQLYPSQEP